MSIEAVREYLSLLWERYQTLRCRRMKALVLDEVCRNLGIHRKSATRLLRGVSMDQDLRHLLTPPDGRLSERSFDLIFPKDARKLSRTHWTPLAAAVRAASLLVDRPGAKILDVGSGCGKFCIVGAATTPGAFTGVELDEDLVAIAKDVAQRHQVERVKFIASDALDVNWTAYDGLYMFNPFANHVASEIEFVDLIGRVRAKLAALPAGCRVVTYHGFGGQMPESFVQEVAETVGPGILQLWVKR